MDFRHDFAVMAREDMRCIGIAFPPEWDDYKVCTRFLQIKQRRFNSSIPYYVLYSKELLQKLPLLSSDDQAVIRRIEWCLKNCYPITPYMSKAINTFSMKKSDYMLKNWEIYHLHLERTDIDRKCKNPNLLFFQAKGQVVHFIDVKKHPEGNGWFDRNLLEIIYNNWPNLLMFKKGLKPTETIPDNAVHNLTKNCVTFIPFHEGSLFPTGFGVMSSGDSGKAARTIDSVFNRFVMWEKAIEKDEAGIRQEIRELHHRMPEQLNFSLIIENNYFVAYEEYAQIKLRMFKLPLILQKQERKR